MPRTKINPHIFRRIDVIQKEIDAFEAERNRPTIIEPDLNVTISEPDPAFLTPEADTYLQSLKDDVEALEASILESTSFRDDIAALKSTPAVDTSALEERIVRTEQQLRCMALQTIKEINYRGILINFEAHTDEGQRWATTFGGTTRYVSVWNADGTGFAFVRDPGGRSGEITFTWEIDTVARTLTTSEPSEFIGYTWK